MIVAVFAAEFSLAKLALFKLSLQDAEAQSSEDGAEELLMRLVDDYGMTLLRMPFMVDPVRAAMAVARAFPMALVE